MKECPFCKKKIQDDARFCLFCMHSLSARKVLPKGFKIFGGINARPLSSKIIGGVFSARLGVIALVVASVIAGCFFLPPKKTNSPQKGSENDSLIEVKTEEESASKTNGSTENHKIISTEKEISSSSEKKEITEKIDSEKADSEKSSSSSKDGTTTTAKKGSTTTTTKKKTSSTTTTTKKSSSTTTTPSTTKRTAEVYTYRAAKESDVDTDLPANCITITGLKSLSSDGVYNIPSSIGGKRVIAIANNAFSNDSISPNNIREVTIPSSVTTIGSQAFVDCKIRSLTLSEGLVSLRTDAFWSCINGLKTLRIPDSVTKFERKPFWNNSDVENLYCGKNTVNMLGFCDEVSFSPFVVKNVHLTNLTLWLNTLPYDVGDFEEGATFMENLYLDGRLVTHLVIPQGVTHVGKDAFRTCTSIKTVTVPQGIPVHPRAFADGVTIIRV